MGGAESFAQREKCRERHQYRSNAACQRVGPPSRPAMSLWFDPARIRVAPKHVSVMTTSSRATIRQSAGITHRSSLHSRIIGACPRRPSVRRRYVRPVRHSLSRFGTSSRLSASSVLAACRAIEPKQQARLLRGRRSGAQRGACRSSLPRKVLPSTKKFLAPQLRGNLRLG
jgi:hypothetical protein